MQYSLYVDNDIAFGGLPTYQTDSLDKAIIQADYQAASLNNTIVVWDEEATDFIYTANY